MTGIRGGIGIGKCALNRPRAGAYWVIIVAAGTRRPDQRTTHEYDYDHDHQHEVPL